jgi:hypothetical protein
LPDGESEIFFQKRLDGANQLEIVLENRTNAQIVRDPIDGERAVDWSAALSPAFMIPGEQGYGHKHLLEGKFK